MSDEIHAVEYRIGEDTVTMHVEGGTEAGEDRVLLDEDDNLIEGRSWADRGFTVERFLSDGDYETIRSGTTELIREVMRDAGVATDASFALPEYHRRVVTEQQHAAIIDSIRRGFKSHRFPVDMERVEARMSEICGRRVSLTHPSLQARRFMVRIVRPGPRDNNPPHRDVWIDRLRHAVNIYVPIAGSNDRSSLCLVPGSHRWPESAIVRTAAGAIIDGVSFSVPAVIAGRDGPLQMIRPDPGPNEVLVFSPYLVHGGAANLNAGSTRVSLEMRFWRYHD